MVTGRTGMRLVSESRSTRQKRRGALTSEGVFTIRWAFYACVSTLSNEKRQARETEELAGALTITCLLRE